MIAAIFFGLVLGVAVQAFFAPRTLRRPSRVGAGFRLYRAGSRLWVRHIQKVRDL